MESESNSQTKPTENASETTQQPSAATPPTAAERFTPDESSAGGLTCAACRCHRNFHRKVYLTARADSPLLVAFARDSSVEPPDSERTAKKRSRTKFSAEQKEKMTRFAEKIGWRIQRGDGDVDEIGQFCREIGVSRQVFKVWMHNHKNSASSSSSTAGNASSLTQ